MLLEAMVNHKFLRFIDSIVKFTSNFCFGFLGHNSFCNFDFILFFAIFKVSYNMKLSSVIIWC